MGISLYFPVSSCAKPANCGALLRRADVCVRPQASLSAPPIINVEFESRTRRKNFRDLAQAFGHCSWSQQRIVALAKIVVIDVEIEREQVDRNRICEAGGKILVLEFLRVRTVGSGELARLPCVE